MTEALKKLEASLQALPESKRLEKIADLVRPGLNSVEAQSDAELVVLADVVFQILDRREGP